MNEGPPIARRMTKGADRQLDSLGFDLSLVIVQRARNGEGHHPCDPPQYRATDREGSAGNSLADFNAVVIGDRMLRGYCTREEDALAVENAYIGILGMVLEDPSKERLECPTTLIKGLDQIGHIAEKGSGRPKQSIEIVGALIGNGLKIGIAALPPVGKRGGEIVGCYERGRQNYNEDEAGQLKAEGASKLHLTSNGICSCHGERPCG